MSKAADSKARNAISGPKGRAAAARLQVLKATDLGNGYALVKLPSGVGGGKAAKGPAAFLDTNVAAIPSTEVNRVIARMLGGTTAMLPSPRLRAALKRYMATNKRVLTADVVTEPPPRVRAKAAAPEDLPPENAAFMAQFKNQGVAARERLVAQGILLTSAELCRRRGVTRQSISKAVAQKRQFWVEGPSGTQLYPAFFSLLLPLRRRFEKVSVALGALPGDTKWQFFTTPKLSLDGKTPQQVLEDDDPALIDRVLRAAATFMEN